MRTSQSNSFRVVFPNEAEYQWEETEVICKHKLASQSGRRIPSHTRTSPDHQGYPVHWSTTTVSQTSATTDFGHIESLCSKLHHMRDVGSALDMVYVGYLLDSADQAHAIHYVPSPPNFASQSWAAYSFQEIFSDWKRVGKRLSGRDKYRIAILLSEHLLQLQGTPWLNEHWGKEDVCVIQRPGSQVADIYKQAFVHRSLRPVMTIQIERNKYDVIQNLPLFDLGVILIELWCESSIEDLQIEADLDRRDTPSDRWCTAVRVLEEWIEVDAPPQYVQAVQRCIDCDFGRNLRRSDARFDKRPFLEAIFDDIIVPLRSVAQVLGM